MHSKPNNNSNEWMDQSIKSYQFGWMLYAGFLCFCDIKHQKQLWTYLTCSIKFHSKGDRELK